jgi:hypothetical protein
MARSSFGWLLTTASLSSKIGHAREWIVPLVRELVNGYRCSHGGKWRGELQGGENIRGAHGAGCRNWGCC